MCKYCKNVKTGDDYEPIISLAESFGFFGLVDIDVYLQKNGSGYPGMVLGLCEYDGKGCDSRAVRINYCPMCGQNLGEFFKD